MLLFHVHTVYMHEHLPFSYTLIRFLPDDPVFARPDTECFVLLITCSMKLDMLRGAGVSLYHSDVIAFLFIPDDSVIFLILYTLLSLIFPFLYSYDIMCGYPL